MHADASIWYPARLNKPTCVTDYTSYLLYVVSHDLMYCAVILDLAHPETTCSNLMSTLATKSLAQLGAVVCSWDVGIRHKRIRHCAEELAVTCEALG